MRDLFRGLAAVLLDELAELRVALEHLRGDCVRDPGFKNRHELPELLYVCKHVVGRLLARHVKTRIHSSASFFALAFFDVAKLCTNCSNSARVTYSGAC